MRESPPNYLYIVLGFCPSARLYIAVSAIKEMRLERFEHLRLRH